MDSKNFDIKKAKLYQLRVFIKRAESMYEKMECKMPFSLFDWVSWNKMAELAYIIIDFRDEIENKEKLIFGRILQ